MTAKRLRWETMDKSQIPLAKLAEQYYMTCRAEGLTADTLRGYEEKLSRLVRWCDEGTLDEFSVELIREYIAYLQSAPKYEGLHYQRADDVHMSAANVQNHVRVIRSFSSWLYRESYTDENMLSRIKVPKAPRKLVKTLTDDEIRRLFNCLDINTTMGCRDAAMLLLFLDTGLRCSELIKINPEDVHLDEQWVKVMGKGQKERIVPFGGRASKLLHRYISFFRLKPFLDDQLFLSITGTNLSVNAIKLVFIRLAGKSKVSRLHIHLLRHTFATRYLMNGGDVFSLQRILGHTTLEMTRRYVDMVAVETEIKKRKPSAMDRFLVGTLR